MTYDPEFKVDFVSISDTAELKLNIS